jgi:hypothetical protein
MRDQPLIVLLLGSGIATAACAGGSHTGAGQAEVRSSSTTGVGSSIAPSATASSTSTGEGGQATTPTTGAAGGGAPSASPAGGQPGTVVIRGTTPAPVAAAPTAAATPVAQGGTWRLTVYYTAVESFHSGPPQAVTGCPPGADECSNGTVALGSYPADFLDAVRGQGAGRITSGKYAGRFLTWDADSGYAVDAAVLDASEKPLQPFVSAASDPGIALGTAFQVLDCGLDSASGHTTDAGGCARIKRASWVVRSPDRRPGDSHALELYVGEEDRPDFATASPLLLHTAGARTTLG